jgi:hypothetical protein
VVQGDISVIEIEFGSKICQEKKEKKLEILTLAAKELQLP